MWVEIYCPAADNQSHRMSVSSRRRELKFLSTWGGNGILCSSPCGDVSCNTESAFKEYLKEGVRSLAETWFEISFVENEVWFRWVRLPKETWIEIVLFLAFRSNILVRFLAETWVEMIAEHSAHQENIEFVSLRRRELKSRTRIWKELDTLVRLLTETWIEMSIQMMLQIVYTVRLLTETWVEIRDTHRVGFPSLVRLLAETWIEIGLQDTVESSGRFVSLRRRELK